MQQQKPGYPFSYGNELTPEMAHENRNKILTILLVIWALKVNQVHAIPLPGTDRFLSTHILYVVRGKLIRAKLLL
jgi:hypothetical protein